MDTKPSYWQRVKVTAKSLKGDGCSSSPDFFYKRCCDDHDIAYRTGKTVDGEPISRAEADKRFYACMRKHGKTPVLGKMILPWTYWMGVRLFGGSSWQGD